MKEFLKSLLVLLIFSCGGPQGPTQPTKPNIIFIMADDLGYGDLGCYGQQLIQTPYIDKMAQEGMRFTQFYAGTSVCAPSRSVLMTGLHTGHTPIRGNFQYGYQNGQLPLADSVTILPEVMKAAGYRTGMIGKWGLGDPGTEGDPLNQGWDHFFGYSDQVLAHNYYPEYLWRNGEKIMLKNEVVYLDTALWHDGLGSYSTAKIEYSHDLFMDEAEAFINRESDAPFFLYLPVTIPHDNGEAQDSALQEVPDQGIYSTKDWGREAKDYAAMVSRLDEGVGRLLALLAQKGIADETLVIFTSDNGSMPDRWYTEFLDSNGPLRGGKRDLYEGGTRVPFVAWWPGVVPPGSTSDHIGAFWDVFPTFAGLAETPAPPALDGISIVPLLTGKADQPIHDYMYWEFHEQGGKQAIRQGDWKAVRLGAKTRPDSALQLYNLREDLAETTDIANQYPDKVQELAQLMLEARTTSSIFPFGAEEVASAGE